MKQLGPLEILATLAKQPQVKEMLEQMMVNSMPAGMSKTQQNSTNILEPVMFMAILRDGGPILDTLSKTKEEAQAKLNSFFTETQIALVGAEVKSIGLSVLEG